MTPQELKNSILQLAIQGKLVPQRPEEKPISLSGLKCKKPEEYEFDLPKSWIIGHIETITDSVPTKQYQILESQVCKEGAYPVISQSKDYSIGFSDATEKLFSHNEPVIVFGDHTTVVKLVDFDFIVGADGVKIFAPVKEIVLADFFYYVLQFLTFGLDKVGGYSRHYKYIKDKAIPIPPLAEQKRIVAKIEELLPLIDRYEEAWTKLESFNKRFPVDMQKSLLQMAIQGKLVDQRPEEGTGEELYAQIQAEKQSLIKAGKIKKDKPLLEITEDEKPFDIPESWKWVRLGEISESNIGLTYKPSDIVGSGGTLVLRSSNIQNSVMAYYDNVFVSCPIPESSQIEKGDLLICARNGSRSLVGKCAIVDRDGCAFGAFMAKIKSPFVPYIKCFLDSPVFRCQLDGVKTETINQITQSNLKNQIIPLPPLAEQKRIVAKLEELLPLCERLK